VKMTGKNVTGGSNITIQIKKKCERNVTVTGRSPPRRVNANLCNPWSRNVFSGRSETEDIILGGRVEGV
jgi:hypothetical protein